MNLSHIHLEMSANISIALTKIICNAYHSLFYFLYLQYLQNSAGNSSYFVATQDNYW